MRRKRNLQVRINPRERDIFTAAAEVAGHEELATWVRGVLLREAERLGVCRTLRTGNALSGKTSHTLAELQQILRGDS